MKSITTLILSLLLIAVKVYAQQFTLNGHLTGEATVPIILSYTDNTGKAITDSALVKNGTFTFKGNIDKAVMASLTVSHRPYLREDGMPAYEQLFLEPGNLSVSGDYNNLWCLKLHGVKTLNEYASLRDQLQPVMEKNTSLQRERDVLNNEFANIKHANEDDPRLKRLDKMLDSLDDTMSEPFVKIVRAFISTHFDSYVSVMELNIYKARWKYSEVKTLYNNLNPEVLNNGDGKQLKTFIDAVDANSANKSAKDFTAVDFHGKPISLSDFKGKYVLIDFWGSWCVPCRAAVPHLKELFAKYHAKGFEVLAIAADDTQADWSKAIKKDGTDIWYNIMQPSRREANIDKTKLINDAYEIHVYPSKILVKDGMIVDRFIGTESTAELDKKLAQIFGK